MSIREFMGDYRSRGRVRALGRRDTVAYRLGIYQDFPHESESKSPASRRGISKCRINRPRPRARGLVALAFA